ncbi:hypothetical protein Q5752_000508 [Cryptotrichosporon argae]
MASPPRTAASPPLDPSKLNHTPAPLPIPIQSHAAHTEPLRAVPDVGAGAGAGVGEAGPADSAYLDAGAGAEPASHPTIAETGALGSPGAGPKTGQLARRESDANREIIKLSSFGGEGLQIKPPRAAE